MRIRISTCRELFLNYETKSIDVYQQILPGGRPQYWLHVASIIRPEGETTWFDVNKLDDMDWTAVAYFWTDVEFVEGEVLGKS